MADYVAAKNIAAKVRVRAAVNQPIVAENLISIPININSLTHIPQ
jgi:hypothetical protein